MNKRYLPFAVYLLLFCIFQGYAQQPYVSLKNLNKTPKSERSWADVDWFRVEK